MKAAFYKTNITPDYPVTMAGFNREKKSEGCIDSIEINTLYWECKERTFVLVVLDCLCIEREFVHEIQGDCSKQLSIDEKDIIIACTHTHSAPAYFKLAFENTVVDKQLQNSAKQQIKDSIMACSKHLETVNVKYGTSFIDGCYGNRNDINLPADKSVQELQFYNTEDKHIGSIVNLAVHPTILNDVSYVLSSDLLGHVRGNLEMKYKTPVLICNGTCGDVSTRFYREMSGIEELKRVAKEITDQILGKMTFSPLFITSFERAVCYHESVFDFNHDDESQKHVLAIQKAFDENQPYMKNRIHLLEEKRRQSPFHLLLEANIVKINDLFIIALPSDVVATLGLRIKQALAPFHVLLICYSNQYSSYLVDENQYGLYFETDNSRLSKGSADFFIELVIQKCKHMI